MPPHKVPHFECRNMFAEGERQSGVEPPHSKNCHIHDKIRQQLQVLRVPKLRDGPAGIPRRRALPAGVGPLFLECGGLTPLSSHRRKSLSRSVVQFPESRGRQYGEKSTFVPSRMKSGVKLRFRESGGLHRSPDTGPPHSKKLPHSRRYRMSAGSTEKSSKTFTRSERSPMTVWKKGLFASRSNHPAEHQA